jgi:hypothetical protein
VFATLNPMVFAVSVIAFVILTRPEWPVVVEPFRLTEITAILVPSVATAHEIADAEFSTCAESTKTMSPSAVAAASPPVTVALARVHVSPLLALLFPITLLT